MPEDNRGIVNKGLKALRKSLRGYVLRWIAVCYEKRVPKDYR